MARTVTTEEVLGAIEGRLQLVDLDMVPWHEAASEVVRQLRTNSVERASGWLEDAILNDPRGRYQQVHVYGGKITKIVRRSPDTGDVEEIEVDVLSDPLSEVGVHLDGRVVIDRAARATTDYRQGWPQGKTITYIVFTVQMAMIQAQAYELAMAQQQRISDERDAKVQAFDERHPEAAEAIRSLLTAAGIDPADRDVWNRRGLSYGRSLMDLHLDTDEIDRLGQVLLDHGIGESRKSSNDA